MHKGGTYLAIGDSTSWIIATYENLYASRVFHSICSNYGAIRHVNKGLGGTSSTVIASIMGQYFLNIPCDLVTIGLGMNDCVNDVTGATQFGTNLTNIINALRSRNPNVEIILCAPNDTTDSTRTPYIANYRAQMQSVSQTLNTFYCDFSKAFTNTPTYSADGIHPNDAGHQLIYNMLYPIVQQTNFVKGLTMN